jgi:hypothetical protein
MSTYYIFAIVKETERRLLVTTLNEQEMDEQGDFGIEMLVLDWCQKKKLTFIDYSI